MTRKIKTSGANSLNNSSSQRITVTLPASTLGELEAIAEEEGISLAEAARRSISRDLALQKFKDRGGEVLVQFPDGRTAYIIPNE